MLIRQKLQNVYIQYYRYRHAVWELAGNYNNMWKVLEMVILRQNLERKTGLAKQKGLFLVRGWPWLSGWSQRCEGAW